MKTLKYAIRFLARSKSYTIINLLGLAFSLACCIILMRYIHRELTVDTHCVDREQVVLAVRDESGYRFSANLEEAYKDLGIECIRKEDIINKCQFLSFIDDNLTYNEEHYTTDIVATDSTFFQIFHYPVVEGVARLSAPDDLVLIRPYAEKIFGKESPIGKTMKFGEKTLTVRGVIDLPQDKTSMNFEALTSIHLYHGERGWGQLIREFIYLAPHADLKAINSISNIYRKQDRGTEVRYEFMTLRENYERTSPFRDSFFQHTNMTYIYLLSGVALLLFLVGILNFVNIYMVLMMTRSKEYGIKKVFGLQGFQLFVQIWLENFLLVIPALFVAWLFIEITQIPVNRLFQEEIGYTLFDLYLSIGFIILMPLITTIYPFVRYNYHTAITSMRSIGSNRQSVHIRMAFLFVQYILTIGIILVSLYFNKHLTFLLETPPGYQTKEVLVANLLYGTQNTYKLTPEERRLIHSRSIQVKQKLQECPFIENYMFFQGNILRDGTTEVLNDRDEKVECITYYTNEKFFDLLSIPIIEGNIPKAKDPTDFRIALNRSAMKAFGYKSQDEAFVRWESPQWIFQGGNETIEGGVQLTPIAGVIENFYHGHLTEGTRPMVFILGEEYTFGEVIMRVHPGQEEELMKYLKEMVMEIYHTDEFTYSWMQDKVEALYEDDRQITVIYSVFAGIAILVSCLGLFGISLFDIRQRYREIAIRKAHGAGMKDLYHLLFKKYLVVLGASFVVAAPLAYWLIHQYTADFVVKAPMGVGIFVAALLLVAGISMGTLWWQIRKAANIDPAVVMKRE